MAAAMAGGSGEPGNFEQNRKVADRLNNLIYRSVLGTVKFNPETRSAVPYPSETNDPSLGMPTLYFQIQENSPERALISPPPYNVSNFMIPPWFKDNGGLPQLKMN
jgi:branched-chain amino acid transport system substrate-binding protein